MKQTMLILGLCLSTLFSSATIVKGNYVKTVKRPGQVAIVVCTKSKNNCFEVIMRYAEAETSGSWNVSIYGNGEIDNVIDRFNAKGWDPTPTDFEPGLDSYHFQLP